MNADQIIECALRLDEAERFGGARHDPTVMIRYDVCSRPDVDDGACPT